MATYWTKSCNVCAMPEFLKQIYACEHQWAFIKWSNHYNYYCPIVLLGSVCVRFNIRSVVVLRNFVPMCNLCESYSADLATKKTAITLSFYMQLLLGLAPNDSA